MSRLDTDPRLQQKQRSSGSNGCRHLPSKRDHVGSNPAWSAGHVAQSDEHLGPNDMACGFEPCRGHQIWRVNPAGSGRRLLSDRYAPAYGNRALGSPPCGSGTDGCASVFQADEARSLLATRSNPRSSTLVRMSGLSSWGKRIVAATGDHFSGGTRILLPLPWLGHQCAAISHKDRAARAARARATKCRRPGQSGDGAGLWLRLARFKSAGRYTDMV